MNHTAGMPGPVRKPVRKHSSFSQYLRAVVVVVICTFIAGLVFPNIHAANLSMVFLTGIVITALYYGRGPSILATILSAAAFDVFFTEPYGTFSIAEVQYVLTLLVMLLVAVTISTLAVRSREQTAIAQEREHRTASLYALNHKLSGANGLPELYTLAVQHIGEEFGSSTFIYSPENNLSLQLRAAQRIQDAPEPEIGIAQWVYDHRQAAGSGTDNLAGSTYLYIPLKTSQKVVGVIAMLHPPTQPPLWPADRQFLDTVADQVALAIERAMLTEEVQQARMQAETERLRSNLLSSVSHDFRTPLASIMGAASTLLEQGLMLDPKTHDELAQLAYEEAHRLNRLVGNLLDMTRLESGGLHIEKEWQTLEEVVGAALRRLGKRRRGQPIVTNLPPDLPLVPMDSVLIEQVLVNLLENAIKYAPEGKPIELSASATAKDIVVEIADQGPGIVPGDEEKIFNKFYRSANVTSEGVGLGLTICRGIIEAHQGKIEARTGPAGGAVFRFTLPLEGEQPHFDEEL
jgi:two-component system sensor histidine kinase KdpD